LKIKIQRKFKPSRNYQKFPEVECGNLSIAQLTCQAIPNL
jgi:hypothetical protein